ncbi:hypothetical protein BKA69DRAFT_120962 [Paraphysoderma sedebokerense]|nr:hypothetical protein BKA69DRAFT_120962 [Paraphysoderma sedebokerense]
MPLSEYEQQDQRLTNRIPKPLQIVNIITATTPGKKLVDADPLIPTFEVLPDTKYDDNRLAGVSGIPKHFYQQFFSGGGVKPGQLQIPNGNMGSAPNSALTVAVASPPLKEDAALQNLPPPMPITDMTMMSVPANMPPPPLQDLPPIPLPIMPVVGTLRKGAAPPPPVPVANPNANMTMSGTVGAAFAEAFSALKQMDSLAEELTEEIPQSQAAAANSQNQMNYAPATVKGFPFTGTLGKPQNDGSQSQGGGSVREKSFVGTMRDQQAQAQQQMLMGTIRDQQQMAQQQGDMSNFNMPLGGTVNAAFAEAFSGLQQMQNMGGIVELEEQQGYGMQSGNTLSVGMNSTGMYSNDPSQSQFQMAGMQNNMGMNMGMDPNMQQQQYDQQYQMQNDMAYQNQQYGNEMGYQQQYQGDMQYQNDMAYQQQYGNVNDMQYQQQGGYGTVNGMATMNGRMTVGGAIDFTSLLGNNGTDQNQFNGYQQ